MKQVAEKLKGPLALIVTLLITTTVCSQKPAIDWVNIPAGTFTMGSPTDEVGRDADETRHQVTLSAFRMSKQEITVAQYKTFIDATGYVTDADKGTGGFGGSLVHKGTKFENKPGVNWKCDVNGKPRPIKDYNHPVIHVSWNDANAFAEWMGCRLPSEAQWEFACRAGTTTEFGTGNNLTTSEANYNGNYPHHIHPKGEYREKTMPVGSFAPNAYGLYDMHGNVWEWCSDGYGEYSSETKTDPEGPESLVHHIYRGGSWFNDARYCRSAYRSNDNPVNHDSTLGFRLVSIH